MGHGKDVDWQKYARAMEDDSIPKEERISLLEEKKGFLTEKLAKIDAKLAELKG